MVTTVGGLSTVHTWSLLFGGCGQSIHGHYYREAVDSSYMVTTVGGEFVNRIYMVTTVGSGCGQSIHGHYYREGSVDSPYMATTIGRLWTVHTWSLL